MSILRSNVRANTDDFDWPSGLAALLGPPGIGKSAMAQVIANEMAADFQEVLGQSLNNVADVHALLLAATEKSVCHIDEAHEIPKSLQTTLYLALDKRKIFVNSGGRTPQPIPIANFSLILSTTDEYKLLPPLRDRMRLVLRLGYLSIQELCQIVIMRSRALGWDVHEMVVPAIAKRAKGTPRLGLRLLQSSYRVCRAAGESTITPKHLKTACVLDQIDSLGLDATEQEYLKILAEGPTRLNVIASCLGLPARTVSEVTESFLVRYGFVGKTKDGLRELLPKGREHLAQFGQDAVRFL